MGVGGSVSVLMRCALRSLDVGWWVCFGVWVGARVSEFWTSGIV